MRPVLSIFENQQLILPAGARRHQQEARLLRLRVGGAPAFETRSGRLFARQFAGAIDLDDVRIEVLPKSHGIDSHEEARGFLYNLLRCVGDDATIGWVPGSSETSTLDLLEVVERRTADELVRRLAIAVPRRYEPVEEVSSVLRGRIQFARLARQNPAMRHLVPVVHCPLNTDNDLSRLLKALARFLWNRTRSMKVRRDLDGCLDQLAQVEDCIMSSDLIARVRLGRYEADWSVLLEFASLLVSGRSPDPTRSGSTEQPSLLFPLNRLFERVVRRVLATHLKTPMGCKDVSTSIRLLSHDGHETLRIIPDIVIERSAAPVLVADAKWKALSASPHRFGVSPDDVYQILAYMRRLGVQKGALLYPRLRWMSDDWHQKLKVSSAADESITIISVDIEALVGPDRTARGKARDRFATAVTELVG